MKNFSELCNFFRFFVSGHLDIAALLIRYKTVVNGKI